MSDKKKRIRISKDVSVQTEGVSLFTIYMKNEQSDNVEIVELEQAELKKIIPLMVAYVKEMDDESFLWQFGEMT